MRVNLCGGQGDAPAATGVELARGRRAMSAMAALTMVEAAAKYAQDKGITTRACP